MSNREIEAAVVAVLKEVQETSGRSWTGLSRDARPIGSLDGFDSLAGLEASVLIEERLRAAGVVESLGDDSLFVEEKRALTLKEVCDRIAAVLTGAA